METTPHDPFQPPKASLEVPVDKGPRPKRVKAAALLIATAAVLSFIVNAAMWTGLVRFPNSPQGTLADIVSALVTLTLLGFLAWKIHAGRNWARLLFSVLVALGVLGFAISLPFAPELMKTIPTSLWVTSTIQTGLQVAALFLVFTGDASPWFRKT